MPLRQFTADLVAERAVERREHRLRLAKRERQQRQRAGRRHPAERRACHKEFERPAAHIGEHFGVGAEPALRKHLESEFAAGFLADRLRHLGEASDGRAAGRLVQAQAGSEIGR